MNIVVCAKIVPLASVTIQIDPATKRIIRTGVSQELDPQAAKAVEEALRLADRHGGSVTLVVMGRDDATVGIRSALAMGATAAVHLSDPALAGSDALGTSKALAAAIRKTPFDLVLCATESSDSYTGLVPGQLAQLLGIPPLTFATALTVDGNVVTIKRQSEGGYDTVSAELPALVTVTTGINEPRYPTLKGIMGAKRSGSTPPPISASGRATSARPELASACSPWAARLRGHRAGPSRTRATAENRSPSSSSA